MIIFWDGTYINEWGFVFGDYFIIITKPRVSIEVLGESRALVIDNEIREFVENSDRIFSCVSDIRSFTMNEAFIVMQLEKPLAMTISDSPVMVVPDAVRTICIGIQTTELKDVSHSYSVTSPNRNLEGDFAPVIYDEMASRLVAS